MKEIEGEYAVVPIDSVRPHPKNPNRNSVSAIAAAIEEVGFYGAVVVRTKTGHILAGEHRWRAAAEAGMAEIPVIFVDVSAARGLRILLADNQVQRLGRNDQIALASLVHALSASLHASRVSAATGLSSASVESLVDRMEGFLAKQNRKPSSVDDLPVADIRTVKLYYSSADHARFLELVRSVIDLHPPTNLAAAVLYAVRKQCAKLSASSPS